MCPGVSDSFLLIRMLTKLLSPSIIFILFLHIFKINKCFISKPISKHFLWNILNHCKGVNVSVCLYVYVLFLIAQRRMNRKHLTKVVLLFIYPHFEQITSVALFVDFFFSQIPYFPKKN